MSEGYQGDLGSRQRRIAEAAPLPGKRILLIGDREPHNFEALRDYANLHQNEVQLGGLIVPGAELDQDIISMADHVSDMRSQGVATHVYEESGSDAYHFQSPGGVDFSYGHAPYEAARLREEGYRREYCSRLVEMARSARPDLIFLSNFKVVLDPVFVEAFGGKIVNVHPSVLPLLKGFRPEYRSDQGEEPDASGYTLHLVDNDLDGGPTLFQQRVPLEPRNADLENRHGKEYDKKREEAQRLKIIQAQAKWSPRVLALVASDTLRKVVSGEEAFAAEGRPGFTQTEAYQRFLQSEYEKWRRQSGDEGRTFKEWATVQKPYCRVLFDKGNGWQTAEAIFGAPEESNEKGPDIVTRYSFKIPGAGPEAVARFARLLEIAEKVRERRGIDGGLKTRYLHWPLENPPYSTAFIEFPYDAEEDFKTLIEKEMHDVELDIETKPTRVTAPRKPFRPTEDIGL